jgi:hypothetical protein
MMWIYREVRQAHPERYHVDLVTYEVGFLQAQEAVRSLGGIGNMPVPPVVDVFRTVETYETLSKARVAVHYLNGGSAQGERP